MKRNRRNNLMITLSILVVLVVGITIVYAALSASLKVSTSNVTQNVASWNVGFEVGTGTIKGAAASSDNSSTTSISCGDATVTTNSISIAATTLTKPGDYCGWTTTIKNSGTIDAKLTAIQTTVPSGVECTGTNTGSLVCGNIRYYILVAEAPSYPVIAGGRIIPAGGSLVVSVFANYTGNTLNANKVTHAGVGFTLVWSQN